MSNFTEAMTALKTKLDAIGTAFDPAHIQSLDSAVATLQTQLTANSDADAKVVADLTDIKEGLAILAGTTTPESPPESQPDSAA